MPKPFYRIEMMPARHGDALLVEYGESETNRLLIDGGPLNAWPAVSKRLGKLPAGDQKVELLVVTHVDTDHIEGIIRLMAMPVGRWPIDPQDIWFNGWRHLEEAADLGGREGEMMSALIHFRAHEKWNKAFGGNAVRCDVDGQGPLSLEGGMRLTLVSPDADALARLMADWKKKVGTGEWAGVEPGDLEGAWEKLVEENKFRLDTLGPEDIAPRLLKLLKGGDPSKANRSSIAFLAEYGGRSCLFLGDASPKVVCPALGRLGYSKARPLRVDAVKVSHHGSKNNLTKELLSLVDAEHWLISTNGDVHEHPDAPAIDAIIAGSIRKPTLWFNYRSKHTQKWEKGAKKSGARYSVEYPRDGKEGIVVRL